jgi:hypothetical protein
VNKEDDEPQRICAGQYNQLRLVKCEVGHCRGANDIISCLETYPLLCGLRLSHNNVVDKVRSIDSVTASIYFTRIGPTRL